MKTIKNTGGKSPGYLSRFMPIALAYLDGDKAHAQSRFRNLIATGGKELMEAVAGSDARLKYKLVAAKLALGETGRNDLLHDAIGILSAASVDRHGRLINAIEPLGLHLAALMRWQEGMGQVVEGPAPEALAARIRDEQPDLIADIVARQPETKALFPGFAPRAAFRPAADATTATESAAAPVQRISITVNGTSSPAYAAETPRHIRIFRSVGALQHAVDELLVHRKGRFAIAIKRDALHAIELIDFHADRNITDKRLRNCKGVALMNAVLLPEAASYLEALMQPGGGHERDEHTPIIYSKVLCRMGRSADAVTHLAPLVTRGRLQKNCHAHIAYAFALGDAEGDDRALAYLDALAAPGGLFECDPRIQITHQKIKSAADAGAITSRSGAAQAAPVYPGMLGREGAIPIAAPL